MDRFNETRPKRERKEATGLEPNFDPLFSLLANSQVFINADGERPSGMTQQQWNEIILHRFPLHRHCDPMFLLREWDRQQCHLACLSAYVQLKMTSEIVQQIGTLLLFC
jgi:hypothetical protein